MTLHGAGYPELELSEEEKFFSLSRADKVWVAEALRTFGFTNERVYVDIGVAAREFSEELSVEAMLE